MLDNLLVFRLELPLELAPSMNVYSNMPGWKRAKLRKIVDGEISKAKQHWKCWPMGVKRKKEASIIKGKVRIKTIISGGKKRKVIVTRYSSKEPDDIIASDCIGGKIPLDRLCHACIIRDDSRKWIERQANWVKVPPKQGKVVLEVFEN